MTLDDIKSDFYARWVAPDGCVKLSLDDEFPPFPGQTLNRVGNENGILYLAYMMMWMHHHKIFNQADEDFAMKALIRTRASGAPGGLYDRHPGNVVSLNSHDNIVGALALGALCGIRAVACEMEDWGDANGWSFNNVTPVLRTAGSFLQGGDVAFIKWCASKAPAPWESAWFYIGCAISLFSKKPYIKNLRALRLYILGMVTDPASDGFTSYFSSGHPIRLLAEWNKNTVEPSSLPQSAQSVG